MFNNENGYSLADIAAATGNSGYGNDGFFGGAGGWWIILLFLFAFGGWGNGGWGNNGNGNATMPYLYNMDSNSDKFYDLNTGILNGFATTTAAITLLIKLFLALGLSGEDTILTKGKLAETINIIGTTICKIVNSILVM